MDAPLLFFNYNLNSSPDKLRSDVNTWTNYILRLKEISDPKTKALLLITLFRRAMAYLVLKDFELAKADLRFILETETIPAFRAAAYIGLHQVETTAGEDKQAVESVSSVIELCQQYTFPEKVLAEVWYFRAKCYLKLGKYQEAVADCVSSLQLKENGNVFMVQGLALASLGEKEQALLACAQGIQLSPSRNNYVTRGRLYTILKEPEKAQADFAQALLLAAPEERSSLEAEIATYTHIQGVLNIMRHLRGES